MDKIRKMTFDIYMVNGQEKIFLSEEEAKKAIEEDSKRNLNEALLTEAEEERDFIRYSTENIFSDESELPITTEVEYVPVSAKSVEEVEKFEVIETYQWGERVMCYERTEGSKHGRS